MYSVQARALAVVSCPLKTVSIDYFKFYVFKVPSSISGESNFYRPQKKFGARLYFYTCLPFCSQGGSASVHAGISPTPRAGTPLEADTPLPWSRSCWEIRSTSGRYASYWNAILFIISLLTSDSEIAALIKTGFRNNLLGICRH